MAEKVLMIALSPTMDEGTIVTWKKKEGESIAVGDVLCVVETDKAAMDYEFQSAGTLLKILVPEGAQAKVADPIAIVGKPGENIASLLEAAPTAKEPARVASAKDGNTPVVAAVRKPSAAVATPAAHDRVRSSPLARKLAAERGLDLSRIGGSGPSGRIVRRDVEGAAGATARATTSAPAQGDTILPVTGKRRITAQRLSESKQGSPHYYLTVSVEMDSLMAARAELNEGRETKISLNAFLHKITAQALMRHPEVNASWQGDTIRRFGSVDLGLAVALPDGLVTPVVRSCQTKGVLAIDTELAELVKKARNGKLTPPDYTGATFTISNLGSFGIEVFTAIINPPGAAILALGAIRKTPVVLADGSLGVRQMMKATLSCDHRVIDGAVGAHFLKDLKQMVENPYAALL